MRLYDGGFDAKDVTSVASGSAVARLFVTLGVVYLVVMLFGAWLIRVPADGWVPEGFDPSKQKQQSMVTTASVSANNAIKTPQFWLLWVVLFCNVTAGIGILEQAAPMIQDFFRGGERLQRRPRPRLPASSGCCRSATWPAGSCGPRPRT